MISTLLLCFALQNPDLEAAVADAAALGAKGQFAAAVATLRDAGVEESANAAAWLAYATWSTRQLESDIAAGRVQGLDIVDGFSDVAWLLEQASALEDAPAQVWVDWSEALLNANDLSRSLKVLEEGRERFPHQATLLTQQSRVQLAKARMAVESGDKEAAQSLKQAAEVSLRQAIREAPKSAAPRLRLGELLWTAYVEGGAESESLKRDAIASYLEAVAAEAEAVDPGLVYNWLQTDAIPVLDALLAARPDDVLAYWYRGSAHYALGPDHWPQLRDDFLKVLELNPEFSNAYYFLADGAMRRGTALDGAGDAAGAAKAFRAAAGFWAKYLEGFGDQYRMQLKQGGDGGKTVAQQMNWLAGKNDLETGIVLLRWAVGTDPNYADAWNNLAFFLREAGHPEEARDAYARALELQPDDPQVMNDYAVIFHYYLKERLDFAEELYVKAAARAQEMLDNGEVDEADRARIQTALRDAKNNLAKLKKGETEE